MLEKLPHWIGSALANVRAGHDKLAIATLYLAGTARLDVTSPAFAAGGRLPVRFTADGAGVSPPLLWRGVPDGTHSLALIVEDPDAPAPRPFVHAVVTAIDPALPGLDEGAIRADGDAAGEADGDTGRNSYLQEGWLPPDPPTGHGSHDYVFQLFALAAPAGDQAEGRPNAGRSDFRDVIDGRILAAGILVGTYSRGQEADAGPAGAAVASAPAG
ncbi:YbhB/YbcL family Raf kinase inhibitor-like protein [Sphingomonas sabuli]|uniref:YbhB/YbcL family Raf kinase inhibitor-like protein n=1 Tax=Sphingomonas sabuli TaxID=2764186 RepID=A0A7G9KZM0_9SPHN|nr:YbhB/YbcL family Raf kinase inhibitor-like protein [Sphingomonas sabuli]QNM81819.1 YbhB/YbcL family Raf kinase inhibitor-like protein [Sphingomonas sabuli]